MALPQPVKRYTPQEYYALERQAEYKSDYYKGEIFNMSGGTANHSLITANIAGEVRNRLKGKPCRAYESNLRLAILATGLRCYPDVSVYCGPLQFDPEDNTGETATNPTVLFEVLSKSTEGYDRGLKAENYRQIASLRAYVLVSQRGPHVEVFERQANGHWLLGDANGLDAVLTLPAIGIDLPLAEIYDGVEFLPPEPTPTAIREL
jgi:Uma2 family endonuclease